MNPRPQPVTIAPIAIAPVTMAPVPPCARLAAICAAIDGREVTCPATARRTCATLAALRSEIAA
ncbi:hypothetical protein [Amaricoccus sp. W119]|uniref:hypothetical protein n=1 Tax=Amaricoccus sp. W119 TaxID=3391833 RepID=UPI0039A76505